MRACECSGTVGPAPHTCAQEVRDCHPLGAPYHPALGRSQPAYGVIGAVIVESEYLELDAHRHDDTNGQITDLHSEHTTFPRFEDPLLQLGC